MEIKLPPWSYSSIKTFEQCPRKYYHLKVVKDYTEDQNAEHLLYGKAFHKAAEEYVRDGTPIPPQFGFIKDVLDVLRNYKGTIYCEYEMGLTENLEPCGFKDANVWWRGIADYLLINGEEARVVDYKTSKSTKYADRGQLELMALAVFKHFPEVQVIKAGLLFVIVKEFIKAKYSRKDEAELWKKWLQGHGRVKMAYSNGVWNPSPSGLCKKHCVVLSCPHNGRN